ncbi:MAG: c-type cytochrome [Verrucomicrobiales bacterium]
MMRRVLSSLSLLPALLAALTASFIPGSEAAVALNPSYASSPKSLEGERLLSELNCIACHKADETTASRLNTRTAPYLGTSGQWITPGYLRRWLSDPHAHQPGTAMPNLLHGLSEEKRAEAVEMLTHFLVASQAPAEETAVAAEPSQIEEGNKLYHSIGCVACHRPESTPVGGARGGVDQSVTAANVHGLGPSIPLGDLARKTTVAEMTAFLLDPSKVRPSGRMPSFGLTASEAKSVSMYLLKAQVPGLEEPSKAQKIGGLSYHYFEGDFAGKADFGTMKPVSVGTINNFLLSPKRRNDNFGFRFSGYIRIATPGAYTFYLTSDDGSRLYIGSDLVIQNDGDHAPVLKRGVKELTAGDHPIGVSFYNAGAGYELTLEYEGPGIARQKIPDNVLSHIGQPMIPLDYAPLPVDAVKVAAGRQLFASIGCASCHLISGEPVVSGLAANPLNQLNPEKGCLADKPSEKAANYDLSVEQRAALRSVVARVDAMQQPLSHAQQVTQTMARLNCHACHTRDGYGGPNEARLNYFGVIGDADMGEEGRIPPHLTGVGAKLTTEWMRQVLLNKGWVRPYMATRMPQYTPYAIGSLPTFFEQADGRANALPDPRATSREAKFGRKLVGTGGLACISCHTYAERNSLGIPALDLTSITPRLKYDWFHRYLIDPPSLRPGTRMPSFWPDGVAVHKETLDGNTDAQIEAIWAYLGQNNRTDLPPGLVQGKMEIVADKEAVIYRNFIEGAGVRAIGVGYPEKANLAFDANTLRVAMLWQGPFMDAARHSIGRGAGFEPPLGNNVISMPPGPTIAMLPEEGAAWPESISGASTKFRGYALDEIRRPAFNYSIGDVSVIDAFVALQGEIDPFFRRTLEFTAPDTARHYFYRAGTGSKITKSGDNTYLLDDKVTLRLDPASAAAARIRSSKGRQELLIPLTFNNQKSLIVQEIIW